MPFVELVSQSMARKRFIQTVGMKTAQKSLQKMARKSLFVVFLFAFVVPVVDEFNLLHQSLDVLIYAEFNYVLKLVLHSFAYNFIIC